MADPEILLDWTMRLWFDILDIMRSTNCHEWTNEWCTDQSAPFPIFPLLPFTPPSPTPPPKI